MVRCAGLHPANLFRFLRLHRYGTGYRADVRHPPANQLQLALQGDQHHRILAVLAYDAVALPARLSVYSAGRQPQRRVAPLPEPDDYDAARRAVAWCRLDLRDLGSA